MVRCFDANSATLAAAMFQEDGFAPQVSQSHSFLFIARLTFETAASLLGRKNHMISWMPCSQASIVSPKGTPLLDTRTADCPLVSTQSSVTPFQQHLETAAINVATCSRPVTGTPAARTSPPPS